MAAAKTSPKITFPKIDGFADTVQQSSAQALEAWTHGWQLYFNYLNALMKARKPEDYIVANADLFTDGTARFSSHLANWNSHTAPTLAPAFPE